jgi:hypothetical protein
MPTPIYRSIGQEKTLFLLVQHYNGVAKENGEYHKQHESVFNVQEISGINVMISTQNASPELFP